MPTRSPLPVVAKKKPPGPKLVGPVNPVYPVTTPPSTCPVSIAPKLAFICGTTIVSAEESQSGQVNGSGSVRHNIGPDLLQRYGVSLSGSDGEERGDGNSEKYER